MDEIIDGIHIKSYIKDLKTGTTLPYDGSMSKDVLKSLLNQLSPQEIEALPKAAPGAKSDFSVKITKDGKTQWNDA